MEKTKEPNPLPYIPQLENSDDEDDFISAFEKMSYADGWPEDSWEKHFDKHPFFMTEPIPEGEPLPPMLEALQQIKYDREENTPEELALNYKDDGNENFKIKKYRFAIDNYTEGLKQRCENQELNAQLLTNRAAANFYLKNHKSALLDCQKALMLKPDHMKALVRAAECCYILHRNVEGLQCCEKGLSIQENDKLTKLKKDFDSQMKLDARDKRKAAYIERKNQEAADKLVSAIEKRGIKIARKENSKSLSDDLTPSHPDAFDHKVHFDIENLVWPVFFMYPEYEMTDFIQEFNEESRFEDHLQEMFGRNVEPAAWDQERKYKPEMIIIYFQDRLEKLHEVPCETTLLEILTDKHYTVYDGTPKFYLMVRGSDTHKRFVLQYI